MTAVDGIRSVGRAVHVLEVLAGTGDSGLRLSQIVEMAELSKTTTHRILSTLQELNWVEMDPASGCYYLGMLLVGPGLAAANRHGLLKLANPHLLWLAEMTADTVYLSVRAGSSALCIDRVTGAFPIRTLTLSPGDRRPLGSGAGSLALLAWLARDEIDSLIMEQTKGESPPHGISDPVLLNRLVDDALAHGFAHNPGLLISGAEAVGVPVFGADGFPVAALSVAAIASRLDEQRREQIASWLMGEADALSKKLLELDPNFESTSIRRLLPRYQE